MSRDTNRTTALDRAQDGDLCRCGCPASSHGDGVVLDDGRQPGEACFECMCEEFVPACPCGVGDAHDAADHLTAPLPLEAP
jgi:hypothetical protein